MFLLGAGEKRNHWEGEKNVCDEMKLTSFEYLAMVRDGYLKNLCLSLKILFSLMANCFLIMSSRPVGILKKGEWWWEGWGGVKYILRGLR